MGAGSLRGDQPSGLSDPLRRLAQPLIQFRTPQISSRTVLELPCLRLHLLCALVSSQNVVGVVDCGLRLAASYASLMPSHNPIDP
jgi:hypothetical protein